MRRFRRTSTGADRNRITIGCLIWAVFHELHPVVQRLREGHLAELLGAGRDPLTLQAWERLVATADRWRFGSEAAAASRLAASIGDLDVMKAGLAAWPNGTPLVFSTADRTNRAQTMFHMGFDLLVKGLGWNPNDFERLVQRGIEDHVAIVDDAMTIFFGALHAKGAPIPPPSVIAGGEGTDAR
jgi:hypothetical protein